MKFIRKLKIGVATRLWKAKTFVVGKIGCEYMFCEKCGNKLMEGDNFCEVCGTKANKAKPRKGQGDLNLYQKRMVEERNNDNSQVYQGDSYHEDRPSSGVPYKFIISFLLVLLIGSGVFIVFLLKNDKPDMYQEAGRIYEVEDMDQEGIGAEQEGDTSSTTGAYDFDNMDEEEDLDKDEKEEVQNPSFHSNERFLFQTDRDLITERDLREMDEREISIVRNEIYARHGYIFTKDDLIEYFSNFEWYNPDPNFSESRFNEYEKENIKVISAYEKKMGWR